MLIPRSREKHPRSFMEKTTAETLPGVYPERTAEILRFAQNDRRRAQGDRSSTFHFLR